MPELLREHEFQGVVKDQSLINNPNLDTDVVRLLLQIVNKKEESSINSQIEANKKQQGPPKAAQTFRPSLILITGNQKTKEAAYAWFKQLANNESLVKLAKKIPVFNKRAENLPEILITLFEYQVPITRAVWFFEHQQMHPSSANSGTNAPPLFQQFSLENFMNVENLSLILLPIINHGYFTEQKLKCLWNFTTKLMR